MTTIRYDRDDMSMEISGHAGGGPHGADIICAAISALEQTLLRALTDMDRQGDGRLVGGRHDTPGEVRMRFIPKAWARFRTRSFFDFTMLGMRMIAEQYPENVHIEEENEDGTV